MLHVHDHTGRSPDWVASGFGNAAFDALKTRGAPLLILSGEPLGVIWANVAAADAFGADDRAGLARLIFGSAQKPLQRFDTLRRRLRPASPPFLERIRIVQGLGVRNITALCSAADTPAGPGLAIGLAGIEPKRASGEGAAHWWQPRIEPEGVAAIVDGETAMFDLPEPATAFVDPVEGLRSRLRAAFGGRVQRRFLWRTDAADRLVESDERLFDELEAAARPRPQQPLTDAIGRFDSAGAKRLQDALASQRSWSGVEITWPIGGGQFSLPITLGAAPQFDAGRGFYGFRGFGVADLARLAVRSEPALEILSAAPAEASSPAELAGPQPDRPAALQDLGLATPETASDGPGLDPAAMRDLGLQGEGESPIAIATLEDEAEPLAQDPGEPTPSFPSLDSQANVVRLWPAPVSGPGRGQPAAEKAAASDLGADDPGDADGAALPPAEPEAGLRLAHHDQNGERNGSLTSSEHSAFREIALVLGGAAYPEASAEARSGESGAGGAEVGADAPGPASSSSPNPAFQPRAAAAGDDAGRHWASIIDMLPLGLMVLRGAELLFANRALLDAFHCPEVADLPPDLAQAFFGRGLNPGEPRTEAKIPVADGTSVALAGEARPLEWDGGAAVLWLLHPTRAGAAEAPAPAIAGEAGRGTDARQLGALVDAASDAIATIDESGRILTLNRQGERWFGRDRRRLAGESFTLLLAPESRATAAALLAEVKASTDPRAELARETLARTPDGTSLPLQMALARIETGVYSAAWRDLSAQKRLERDMTRARREADRASSHQPEFLAKVSHEIRTPLNAILGFAEIMMDERFGPLGNARYKDYLRDIHTSGTQVMNLINDLLDLSRIEAGRLDLDLAAVDINRIIGECVAEMQTQAYRERIIMRMSLGARLPAITADERSVRQIVSNLLSNAIRYNEPGGQVIVSSALTDAGAVVIRIKDTGIGMSDADIAAALEPFRQLSASKQAGGTGLGLPLTKALAGANGASLSIRSRPREGTMVEVTFPAAAAAAARVPA